MQRDPLAPLDTAGPDQTVAQGLGVGTQMEATQHRHRNHDGQQQHGQDAPEPKTFCGRADWGRQRRRVHGLGGVGVERHRKTLPD